MGRIFDIMGGKTQKVMDRIEDPVDTLYYQKEQLHDAVTEMTDQVDKVVEEINDCEHKRDLYSARSKDNLKKRSPEHDELAYKQAMVVKKMDLQIAHLKKQLKEIDKYLKELGEQLDVIDIQIETAKTCKVLKETVPKVKKINVDKTMRVVNRKYQKVEVDEDLPSMEEWLQEVTH